LTIAGNAVAIHVASERHKAELCDMLGALPGVFIQAGAPMDDQDARTLIASGVIPGEEPGEGFVLIAIRYRPGVHDSTYLL
jgi:hypothetical protein